MIEEHRAPLRFDFLRYFGFQLSAIGDEVTHGATWDLINELKRETGSHFVAALRGYRWAASWGDELLHDLKTLYLSAHLDPKAVERDPSIADSPAPWNTIGAEPEEPEVTPEERERLRQLLRKHSAFREEEDAHD